MPEPTNYHDIPRPSKAEAVSIRSSPSIVNAGEIARLWRPPSGHRLEPPLSTLARVANRLVDRETGNAYSVTELIDLVVASVNDVAGGSRIFPSITAPTDTTVIWLHPSTGMYAIYIGGGWVTTSSGAGIPDGAYINGDGAGYVNESGAYYASF